MLKTAGRSRCPTRVSLDRLSLSEAINDISERLQGQKRLRFSDLLNRNAAGEDVPLERHRLVITFLALLEMAKLRLLRLLVVVTEAEGGGEGTSELTIELRGERTVNTSGGLPADDYRS